MSGSTIKDLRRLSKWVAVFSWASCAAGVVLIYFTALEIQVLNQFPSSEPYSWSESYLDSEIELAGGIAALAYLILFAIAGYLSLRWIYRANANAHLLGAEMVMPPGWNVGWFFVPIATLWKPFEGVSQTWRNTVSPTDPDAVDNPSFMHAWWGCWLMSSILGSYGFRGEFRATTMGAAVLAEVADVASGIIFVPATYFFLKLVRELTAAQSRYLHSAGGSLSAVGAESAST